MGMKRIAQSKGECGRGRSLPEIRGLSARRAIGFNVNGQRAKRAENPHVVLIVRTQLETVPLGDFQGQLQSIDRIESQARLEQWGFGLDVAGRYTFQIQRGDDEFCELALAWVLCWGHENQCSYCGRRGGPVARRE